MFKKHIESLQTEIEYHKNQYESLMALHREFVKMQEKALDNLTQRSFIEAKEKGFDIKVGKFPFSASGKATANGDTDGFVKVIFDAKYGEWLGCHMIGTGVTEMISEAVAARKLETTGHEIIKTIHPHPTLSEAVMEAVAAAYGEVIHI